MDFIRKPEGFDVVVASNLFGDILTDIGAIITGSMGLAPSGNINPEKRYPSLFEPVHGSAPDIAGQDLANPIAMIASVAMMMQYSFGLREEAEAIERAITSVLETGYRTSDLLEEGTHGIGTREMGSLIVQHLELAPSDD